MTHAIYRDCNGDDASRVLRGTLTQCERLASSYGDMTAKERLRNGMYGIETRFIANASVAHKTLSEHFPDPAPGTEANRLRFRLGRAERRFMGLCESAGEGNVRSYLGHLAEECAARADDGRYGEAWGAFDLLTAQFLQTRRHPLPLGEVRNAIRQSLTSR